jgi:hypothetical protein
MPKAQDYHLTKEALKAIEVAYDDGRGMTMDEAMELALTK